MARPTIFTLTFIADAAERAVSNAAGTASALLAAGAFQLLGDVPWYSVASVAALAGLIDILRSLAAVRAGNPGTASFGRAIESGGVSAVADSRVVGLMGNRSRRSDG